MIKRKTIQRMLLVAMLAGITLGASAQNSDVMGTIASGNEAGTKSGRASLSDVVVWLIPLSEPAIKRTQEPAPARATMVQKDKEFHPRLLVLPTGSSVEFPNRDPFFHNVFSLFNGKQFDLGLYEAGESKTVRFDRAGISYIFCNIHPEMNAIVITLSTPYYAVSDPSGKFSFKDVPPGEYEMHIFAEGLNNEDQRKLVRNVTINPEATNLAAIDLPERRLSLKHKNKYGKDYDSAPSAPYEH